MSNHNIDERLSAYLDDELAPAERQQFEALIRQQPELLQVLEQMRQLGDDLRQLPAESLGPEFADRVLAAVQKGTPQQPASPKASTRYWLVGALGTLAAAAALVFLSTAFRPGPNVAHPRIPTASPVEQAVDGVLANVDEGKAVIVRLRLTKDAIRNKTLDQALASAGIAAAPASASNPAAQETAQAYKTLAEKEPQAGGAADVIFIEADAARLRDALVAIAGSSEGATAVSSGGVVASHQAGIGRVQRVEGESGSDASAQQSAADPKNYAQHLPVRGFPLLSACAASPAGGSTSATPSKGKQARVLIVVEVAP